MLEPTILPYHWSIIKPTQRDQFIARCAKLPMDKLVNHVTQAMQQGFNQYAPLTGWWRWKELIRAKVFTLYGQS